MLRKVIGLFAVVVLGVVGLYALNPLGTADWDPRARLLGFTMLEVRSTAMTPTMNPGDRVLVSTFALRFAPPERGDLIAYRYPAEPAVVVLGRVIGTAGDSVAIADGRVSINARLIEEPYLGDRKPIRPYSLHMDPIVVPDGHWFVLGDHRDNAHDSRFLGPLPGDQIVGKVSTTVVD